MFEIIALLSLVNLIILAVILLLSKASYTRAKNFLAFLLLCMAINVLDYYVLHSKLFDQHVWMIALGYVSTAFIGILFYLFVLSMLRSGIILSKTSSIHALPPIIAIVYYVYFQSHSSDFKITYVRAAYVDYPLPEHLLNLFFALVIFSYLVLSLYKIRKYRECQKQNFSHNVAYNIKWLLGLITFILISFTVLAISSIVISNQIFNEISGLITITVFYVFIFFKTLQNPALFNEYEALVIQECVHQKSSINVLRNISQTQLSKIRNDLVTVLEREKLYLIPKLTLDQLADKMQIKKYILSQAINSHPMQNFYSLVNSYRIKEAKAKLISPEFKIQTIEGIGLECGFNSASSFFEVFKKMEGCTPTHFRRLNKELLQHGSFISH